MPRTTVVIPGGRALGTACLISGGRRTAGLLRLGDASALEFALSVQSESFRRGDMYRRCELR